MKQYSAKVVLGGRLISLHASIRKERLEIRDLNLHLKKLHETLENRIKIKKQRKGNNLEPKLME